MVSPHAGIQHAPTQLVETPIHGISEAAVNAMIDGESLLRDGWLYKRGGRTRAWKRRWFVLRKNRFAYYKDQKEFETRKVVPMDDLSGIACKAGGRRPELSFYIGDKQAHLQAETMEDAEAWVRALKLAIRIDPSQSTQASPIKVTTHTRAAAAGPSHLDRTTATGSPPGIRRDSVATTALFSDEDQSQTGFSDEDFTSPLSEATTPEAHAGDDIPTRSVNERADHDKVITQSYLRRHFNSRRHASTHVWAVLRPYGLYLYPDHKEYRPSKIVPMSDMVDASDLPAKSKKHRFQVITRTKALKFSVDEEDQLDTWVGALKSRIEMQELASYTSH